jgi:uncharacterized protein YceH (UPF0502 family)
VLLDAVEARVLGCLIEKEITTPEYYPLTLNALIAACNQKSNRDPAAAYDENDVAHALATLKDKRLAYTLTGAGSRVPKYGHRAVETLALGRRELALVAELLLRGPQTTGELRNRADRMHNFADLDEVEACLRGLMERDPEPLVTRLERQSGMKEPRYAHLLSGPVAAQQRISSTQLESPSESKLDRVAALEGEVAGLKERLDELQQQWEQFRRQFE